MTETILEEVILNEAHNASAESKRIIHGSENTQRPYAVRIIRYDEDEEVYLIEFDIEGKEIIDTFHMTIEGAKKQAKFDWNIKEGDWRKPR